MFIEHIDQLRCTTGHEESWLVAAFTKRDDRLILEAALGCYICLRQYPVIDGVAYFGSTPTAGPRIITSGGTDEGAVRVAAFLNASERSTLVLAGGWGVHAHVLTEMIPLTVFALGDGAAVRDSVHVARVESSEGIPLGHASVHGVALDALTATPRNITTALNVLRPGGRLVAPAEVRVPGGVTVLARDESYWVGEREGDMIALRRA